MKTVSPNSGILVVAAQRELRRSLFDVLDRAGHAHIHSARDATHAAILLEGREPLLLMVAELDGDLRQAQQSCEKLRQLPGAADVPLIAVLTAQASFNPAELAADIDAWMYASQIQVELLARWTCLQNGNRKPSHPRSVDPEDYRYLYEEGDTEWLIVDPETACLIEVSPTVARHSRVPASQWFNLPLSDALKFEGITADQILLEADRSWHPCQRKSARSLRNINATTLPSP
jgi:CheY-like chemotaxis protein